MLLELGAELISSDAVALYELIKNGIDAGSETVEIHISIAIQPSAVDEILDLDVVKLPEKWDPELFRKEIESRLDKAASQAQRDAFNADLGVSNTRDDAIKQFQEAVFNHNSIVVKDTGKGMNADSLRSCYLTVGTPMRLVQRDNAKPDERVPLGEKGIGRLAATRLGHYVHVETGVKGEPQNYNLVLDWRPVYADYNLDASALDFEPTASDWPKIKGESGTSIRIQDLQADWDDGKLQRLSETDLVKLADPFVNNIACLFLNVFFQGVELKYIQAFPSSYLKEADAYCTIEFRSNVGEKKGPTLQVTTDYKRFSRVESIEHCGAHIQNFVSYAAKGKNRQRAKDKLSNSDSVIAALKSLGDFSASFWWYNRGRISRSNPVLWKELEPFIRAWSGGFLVYRDGFRVYPYGSVGDDWLDLDRKALASSAFKLNRAQIVGYLRISTRGNPKLHDQTNREGFRDCSEKEALRRLLRHSIISDVKTYLEKIDKEVAPPNPGELNEIDGRVLDNFEQVEQNLRGIQQRVPNESKTIAAILAQLKEINDAWDRAKDALTAQEDELEQYIHLAGVGLMVELIAHELSRSTNMALEILESKNVANSPGRLDVLKAQLKTINKRVRILDELSIPGRQRKSEQNIGDLVELIKELYEYKAERHGVSLKIVRMGKRSLIRRVEKGQIIQIFDNLLSNAVYWLNRRLNREDSPSILIEVDPETSTVRVMDNGPGVPRGLGDRVFDAFYTTKPAGEGRGLGLYIAKRLAVDNNANLTLISATGDHHAGFELKFKGVGDT